VNIIQPNNGQSLSRQHQSVFPPAPALTPPHPKLKRHNGKYCSLLKRERIVNALAAGDPKSQIARALRVSVNTVYAVAEQEWNKVEQRKARIAAQAERAATKAFDLLNQKLDTQGDSLTASQLVPIAGVSVDKLLVLRGDAHVIAHVDHVVHTQNIFESFQQFHDDALKIIHARQAEEAQQPPPPALPDSPPTFQDPTQ
jgi:Homeodomain-like domain